MPNNYFEFIHFIHASLCPAISMTGQEITPSLATRKPNGFHFRACLVLAISKGLGV